MTAPVLRSKAEQQVSELDLLARIPYSATLTNNSGFPEVAGFASGPWSRVCERVAEWNNSLRHGKSITVRLGGCS